MPTPPQPGPARVFADLKHIDKLSKLISDVRGGSLDGLQLIDRIREIAKTKHDIFALGESANGTFLATAFDTQTAGPGSGRGGTGVLAVPAAHTLHRLAAGDAGVDDRIRERRAQRGLLRFQTMRAR